MKDRRSPNGDPVALHIALLPIVLATAATIVGCRARPNDFGQHTISISPGEGGASSAAEDDLARPYAKGHWRLASQDSLNHVVLWVSHILIRHGGSSQGLPFSFNWKVDQPAATRTREEARALALSVAARAAADPEHFARFAQEYSEDVATSATGGSLGGISAATILVESPAALDALAVLKPGQVSRVIETQRGFEILSPRAPPPLTIVAGREVVVPYDGTVTVAGAAPYKGRSRAEARSIARVLVERVRGAPADFDHVLAEYPAPEGTEPNGDIGEWTNREPGPLEREREQLASIGIGGVTDPIETRAGFAFLLRTAPPGRPEYAVQVIRIGYDSRAASEQPNSRTAALTLARSIARTVSRAPDQIEAFQDAYCCADAELWTEVRTRHDLVAVAAGLPMGGVTLEPLDDTTTFVVVRRVDRATAHLPAILFELPAPAIADVTRLAPGFAGTRVQKVIRRLGDDATAALPVAPADVSRFKAAHDEFAMAFDMNESRVTREKALAVFTDKLQAILTAEQYDRYRDLAGKTVSAELMDLW